MLQAIIPDIIQSLIKNRESILLKTFLAIGIFFAIFLISKFIVKKVRQRIENNSLQNDVYTHNISKLTGNIIFTFLMVFDILAIFQVIGFDTAMIM